jgi:hypothetical protein
MWKGTTLSTVMIVNTQLSHRYVETHEREMHWTCDQCNFEAKVVNSLTYHQYKKHGVLIFSLPEVEVKILKIIVKILIFVILACFLLHFTV